MENKKTRFLKPEVIHFQIVSSYKKVMERFIENMLQFLHFEECEEKMSENMSIKCLRRDYENNESYNLDFYWNHFQKGEKHFLELNKDTYGKPYIIIDSTTYKFTHNLDELIRMESDELYKMYLSLYYANSWFSQLMERINPIFYQRVGRVLRVNSESINISPLINLVDENNT